MKDGAWAVGWLGRVLRGRSWEGAAPEVALRGAPGWWRMMGRCCG
jgi:hypothetical protein